jgi:hypothetical protein
MKEQIIELLECAKVNCDNISKVGSVMVNIVKIQLDEAIKLLGEEE